MSKTLAELHCESFTIRFDFEEKVFNKKKFIKSAGLNPELPVNVGATSGNERGDEHLHISITIDGADSFLLLTYHQGAISVADSETNIVSTEERIEELARAFKVPKLSSDTTSRFVFPDPYFPAIFLGYPLQVGDLDVVVSGQQLTIGKGASKKKAFVAVEKGIVSVVMHAQRTVTLSGFKPEAIAAKDASIVNKLVSGPMYVDA